MIVTMSPAKIMDFSASTTIKKSTKPIFSEQATELIGLLEDYPMEDLAELMSINPKQSFETYQQIHSFNLKKAVEKQAAYTYNGIAYQGLDMESLSEQDIDFAQKHLVILSGLYGVLRPLDMIKPYRLEMQIKLQNPKGNNLYDYWKEDLNQYLSERLQKDDKVWINLMSKEYTKVINKKNLPKGTQIITPDFKEQTSTGYRQVVVHTKKARGMLTRFIIENKINKVQYLKAFDYEGYVFSEKLSDDLNWIFVR